MEIIRNTTPKIKHNKVLGRTSKRYESGSRGAATVSSGRGDYGGVSYGTYQFASRGGNKSSVARFVKQCSFCHEFEGLFPGSPDFSSKWKHIANNHNSFGIEQHHYIKERYYDNAINKLKRLGIKESNLQFGVKELIWSSAVQFGPAGCYNIFKRAGVNGDHSNKEIIDRVYKEKSRVHAYFRSSSKNVQRNIRNRYVAERLQNLKDCA